MLANLAELPLVQRHATLICQQQQHLYFRYLLTPSLSPIHHHQFRSSNCNSSTYMTVCHKDKLLVSQQGCFSVDPKHVNNIQKLVKPNFCSDDVLCLLPSCSNSAKGWFNCGFNHTLEGDDIGKEQRGYHNGQRMEKRVPLIMNAQLVLNYLKGWKATFFNIFPQSKVLFLWSTSIGNSF